MVTCIHAVQTFDVKGSGSIFRLVENPPRSALRRDWRIANIQLHHGKFLNLKKRFNIFCLLPQWNFYTSCSLTEILHAWKKNPGMLTICIKFQGHQTGLNTTKHQIVEAMNRDEKGLKIWPGVRFKPLMGLSRSICT